MTWRVRVGASLCISSGMCVGTAPDRFAFGSGQRSRPVSELTGEDESVRDAAVSCPVEAIGITGAETGAQVPAEQENQYPGRLNRRMDLGLYEAACLRGGPGRVAVTAVVTTRQDGRAKTSQARVPPSWVQAAPAANCGRSPMHPIRHPAAP